MDWFKSAQHACQVTATEWQAAPPNHPNSTPILTVPLPRASLSRHPMPHQALIQLVTKKTWTGFGELPAQKAGQTAGLPASMPCATVLRRLGTSSGKGCLSLHGHGWFSVEDTRARARSHHSLPAPTLIHGVSLGRWPDLFNSGPLICKYLAPCFPED